MLKGLRGSTGQRTHKTLRMTPAMAAGIVKSPMEMNDLVALVDTYQAREDSRPKLVAISN